MRALLVILILLLVALQLKMWFGEGGYRDVQRLALRVEEQERENETLAQRNRELQAEVEDLRQGLEAIEERARSELGLIKENEEFYQVVPRERAAASALAEPRSSSTPTCSANRCWATASTPSAGATRCFR